MRFLARVHASVREAAQAGAILDAYRLADDLIAADLSYPITRTEAVKTILAAGVVYGASMLLDPEADLHTVAPVPANETAANADGPLLLSA